MTTNPGVNFTKKKIERSLALHTQNVKLEVLPFRVLWLVFVIRSANDCLILRATLRETERERD